MNAFNDDNLMKRVSEGDLAHMGMLFERYHVRLYNYFLRLVGSKHVAEDLTQDVFYRILKYRASYKSDVPFVRWIFRIARNVGNDYFSKTGKWVSQDQAPEPTYEPDPTGDLHRQKDLATLKKALAHLAPEKREILLQSRFNGMKYEDIAYIQQTTVAAVKVRVHRAVKELRAYFNKATTEEAS